MGDLDGFKGGNPPLKKGKISEFLERAMDDAQAAQDNLLRGEHAPVPGAEPPNESLAKADNAKPASLPEISARTGMTVQMAQEIRDRAREVSDMLNGDDTSDIKSEIRNVPSSPLRQIDQNSMEVYNLLEEAVDSIQSIHRQLFG